MYGAKGRDFSLVIWAFMWEVQFPVSPTSQVRALILGLLDILGWVFLTHFEQAFHPEPEEAVPQKNQTFSNKKTLCQSSHPPLFTIDIIVRLFQFVNLLPHSWQADVISSGLFFFLFTYRYSEVKLSCSVAIG